MYWAVRQLYVWPFILVQWSMVREKHFPLNSFWTLYIQNCPIESTSSRIFGPVNGGVVGFSVKIILLTQQHLKKGIHQLPMLQQLAWIIVVYVFVLLFCVFRFVSFVLYHIISYLIIVFHDMLYNIFVLFLVLFYCIPFYLQRYNAISFWLIVFHFIHVSCIEIANNVFMVM